MQGLSLFKMVRMEGLEPTHLTALDPKSSVSTNFTTSACSKKLDCKGSRKNENTIPCTYFFEHPAAALFPAYKSLYFSTQTATMKTIIPSDLPVPQLHGLLLGSVGPRPIAFASTVDENGTPNLAPFSFFNVFSANPPMLVFSPARRGRNNTTKHTYENIKKTMECCINIVTYDIVQQTSLASTEYPEGVNEFVKAGLTPIDSTQIKSKRVKESPVQMECTVRQVIELGDQGGAGNLILAEVVAMHIDEAVLNAEGKIDQHKLGLVGRMGGNWYSKGFGDALFEVPKPLTSLGIGVDQIPEDIRLSKILTGNDLGMLGNVEELPDETDVNDYRLVELSDLFVELEDEPKKLEEELHKLAHQKLAQGEVLEAWKTLLAFNN